VRSYLVSGGSPNAEVDVFGQRMTLLQAAILDRETEIAIALLDGGADFTASGARLIEVGANGMTALVDRLLPTAATRTLAETGIANAAGHGYLDTVQSYIRFTDGRRTEEWLRTFGDSAGTAMLGGYDDVARILIDAEARAPDLLHAAARFSSPGMVRHLIKEGFDPRQRLEPSIIEEQTPLDFAWKSFTDRVSAERDQASNNLEYLRGHDAEYILFELLRVGAETPSADILTVARDGLAEIDASAEDSQLMVAARLGFIDVAADLLHREANRNEQRMRNAVIAALETDHDDIARMLINSGAPINGGVLHVAANASSPGMVRDLIRKGADPAERFDGKTPVEWWAQENSAQDPAFILHELIAGGADVCWLKERELKGLSAVILRDSAPECWNSNDPPGRR
jgi:hypothetical protein